MVKFAKIDLLMPLRSKYHAIHYFTKKISEAFDRQGIACRLIDPSDHFTAPIENPPDLTFAINGVPFDDNRTMLCDITGTPHFSYLIDPPYRFLEILSSPNILIGCDDNYCCRLLNAMHFDKTFFLPHGVDKMLGAHDGQKRDIDVLMLASYIDYEAIRDYWRSAFPKIISQTMDDAIDITFSDLSTSFIEAFIQSYQERVGIKVEREKIASGLAILLMLLEKYVKGRERTELIKSIKDARVIVYNGHADNEPGWEKVLDEGHPNITLCEPVDYEEGLEVMKRSKIVLNSFMKNKEGSHDRVFNALACGALPITNENIFMNRHFRDEEEILFFRPGSLDGINDKVNKYLADEEMRQTVAAKGRAIVMASHTWDHRIELLLKNLSDLIENCNQIKK